MLFRSERFYHMILFNHEPKTADSRREGCLSLTPSQNRILNFFFAATLTGIFAAMLGIILYYVYAFASLSGGSHDFDWLLGIFSDFVSILNISLTDSPYVVGGSSYPPLAIAVLYPFALICKNVFAQYDGVHLTADQLTAKVILHPQFWVALILFFILCTASIVAIVIRKYRLDFKTSLKVTAIIVFSAPFVYAIMRGNTIYFALIFLLLFLLLYEHPNPIVREISYFCLVIAGLIKIYPLFFGVFLLHKKKIFPAVRIALYFFASFYLSFFLFEAGFDDFFSFTERLGSFMSNDLRLLSGVNLSLTAALYKFFFPLAPDFADGIGFTVLNLSVLALIFLCATVTAVVTKSDFSRYVIASAIVVLIPSISYFYVLIFELLPFMQFLRDYDTLTPKRRRMYTVLFFFLFFTLSILPKNFILHSASVLTMLIVEIVTVTKGEILPRLSRK